MVSTNVVFTNVVFTSERSLECFHHRINSAGTRNCTNSSLCSGLFFTRLQPSVDVEYFNIEAVSEIQVSEIKLVKYSHMRGSKLLHTDGIQKLFGTFH